MVAVTLSAALAWGVSLATLPRYLHRPRDRRVAAYWHTVTLVALALTISVPSVYLAFDRLLRLPNAARWMENALLLVAAYTIEGFFFVLEHGSPHPTSGCADNSGEPHLSRHRVTRPWLLLPLLVTLSGMAILLWRADLRSDSLDFTFPRLVPALVAYRVLFLCYFSFVIVRFIANATHYRRVTPDLSNKVGLGLTSIAGYFALAYVVLSLVAILTPDTFALAGPVHGALMLTIVLAVACTMIGSTFPLWSRRVGALALLTHLSTAASCWRLGSLWRMLTTAVPEVVLPTWFSWWSALLHPAEMELLLNRRVIEILDARRILLATGGFVQQGRDTMRDEATRAVPDGAPTDCASARIPGEASSPAPAAGDGSNEQIHRKAAREARQLQTASAAAIERRLHAARSNGADALVAPRSLETGISPAGLADGDDAPYRPPTFREQVHYLEWVAAALRWQRGRPRVIARQWHMRMSWTRRKAT